MDATHRGSRSTHSGFSLTKCLVYPADWMWVAPQDNWHLDRAGIVPVQSMHTLADLKSKPRAPQLAILNHKGGGTVEVKVGGDDTQTGRLCSL
ncbi:hypothetical protein PMIN02_009090 [Paraphaeosphaeria minitans]